MNKFRSTSVKLLESVGAPAHYLSKEALDECRAFSRQRIRLPDCGIEQLDGTKRRELCPKVKT